MSLWKQVFNHYSGSASTCRTHLSHFSDPSSCQRMTSSLLPPAICPSYQSRKKDRKEFHRVAPSVDLEWIHQLYEVKYRVDSELMPAVFKDGRSCVCPWEQGRLWEVKMCFQFISVENHAGRQKRELLSSLLLPVSKFWLQVYISHRAS